MKMTKSIHQEQSKRRRRHHTPRKDSPLSSSTPHGDVSNPKSTRNYPSKLSESNIELMKTIKKGNSF